MNKSSAISKAKQLAKKYDKEYVVIREGGEYDVISYASYWQDAYSENCFIVLVNSAGELDYCVEQETLTISSLDIPIFGIMMCT